MKLAAGSDSGVGGGGRLSLFVALYTQTSFLLDMFSH